MGITTEGFVLYGNQKSCYGKVKNHILLPSARPFCLVRHKKREKNSLFAINHRFPGFAWMSIVESWAPENR